MPLHHVHIIPSGKRFNLRVGLFKSFVGWQTAEAAALDVVTRDGSGYGLPCFDNLTEAEAKRIAPLLDAYLVSSGSFGISDMKKERKSISDAKAKYNEAVGVNPVQLQSLPRTVSEDEFWRRVGASGGAPSRRS